MLLNEAATLVNVLDRLKPAEILDVGSGTRADREIYQPHIAAAFHGHRVNWSDMVRSPGVLWCDLTNKDSLWDLPHCELVTCCSMLEHVADVDAAIHNLCSLVRNWLFITVPYSYPEHHCPIDNGWRPSREELCARLVSLGLEVVESYTTAPENFWGVPNASMSVALARLPVGEVLP
jgi:hypothetical protein